MSKKQLNTDAISNELTGASLFFQEPSAPPHRPKKKPQAAHKKKASIKRVRTTQSKATRVPKNDDTVVSHHHATTVDTTPPRDHATMVETIRRAVREFGKEAATHRFTAEEKKQIADLLYVYKQQGLRTSENEITRIAINFLLNDHRDNGENSILYKVLKALNT